MNELLEKINEICRYNLSKITLSNVKSPESRYKKSVIRPIESKGKTLYHVESFTEKQAFHENYGIDDLPDVIYHLMEKYYKQLDAVTQEKIISMKLSKKGKLLYSSRRNTSEIKQASLHNRPKNYILKEGEFIPALCDLGVFTKEGKIINAKYDKYKQINKFIEFIDDAVSKDRRESFNIIDFGCGKSYLTFILYHYMTVIQKRKVKITGLDLKRDVIEKCEETAKRYGYSDLRFFCCDIKDYVPEEKPDMVISLHACDTATDFALYNACIWNSDYIFAVPCCQHELNSEIKAKNLSLLTDYGIIKERFSALATDAVRAKLLEYVGYEVDMPEFIDIEHSPKNILIRAKAKSKVTNEKKKAILSEIRKFTDEFSTDITLSRLILKNPLYFE